MCKESQNNDKKEFNPFNWSDKVKDSPMTCLNNKCEKYGRTQKLKELYYMGKHFYCPYCAEKIV